MRHEDHRPGEDLQPVIELLRAARPEATPLELDAVKQRVLVRAQRNTSGGFMRSRLAILGALVLGMLLSTTGAGLAVSGFTDDQQASVAQYVRGETDESPPADQETLQPTRQVAGASSSGSSLPFTGFAAIPVLLGGLAILSTGLVLRRRSGSS